MEACDFFTIEVFLMLGAIVASLVYALYTLLTYEEGSSKTVKALTWRILLAFLFLITLVIAIGKGWISPNSPPL